LRVSYQEAVELLAKKRVEAQRQQGSTVLAGGLLEQAVVASEYLTSSHEWNVFLQRVQALVDQERKLMAAMGDALALPNLTSEQVLQGQRHMLATKAKIEAWEQVLRLPKEIIDRAGTPEQSSN
jgi:hypothetical protein